MREEGILDPVKVARESAQHIAIGPKRWRISCRIRILRPAACRSTASST
jgi:hypothetical protein